MKTLIVNGSPKAEKGNTEIFIQQFNKGMKVPCEVCYAAKESSEDIVRRMEQFDVVIVAMPLYIHAMPGIVMKIIECMESTMVQEKAMGFIVQSGFVESGQSQYLERYLSALTKRLRYTYLGTVIKGGSAGTYLMPEKMNKKLFEQLRMLGQFFELYHAFDPKITKELAKPNQLTKGKSKFMQLLSRLHLGDGMFFNMMLKKNHAFSRAFDRPFANEEGYGKITK